MPAAGAGAGASAGGMSATNGDRAAALKKNLKITVVGDGTVGKTCMLIVYKENRFPDDYVPTVFDNYPGTVTVDGVDHAVVMWDTAGQEEYERLRPLSYPNTDIFLLCYAVDNMASFANVKTKWRPELRHHCPSAPVLLVGTKTDMRAEKPNTFHKSDGKALAKKIGAMGYEECSALSGEGVTEVFQAAVGHVVRPRRTAHGCGPCSLL